jgi:hypothetical protein
MHFNINKDRAVRAAARTLVSIRGQGLAQREDSLVTTLKLFDNFSRKADVLPKLGYGLFWLVLFVVSLGAGQNAYAAIQCNTTITANVVVLDNPTIFNRLGAQNPNWIMYALERDVVDKASQVPCSQTACTAGNVELRRDKRPRPLVIRSIEGSCLTVNFTNLLFRGHGRDPDQQRPGRRSLCRFPRHGHRSSFNRRWYRERRQHGRRESRRQRDGEHHGLRHGWPGSTGRSDHHL